MKYLLPLLVLSSGFFNSHAEARLAQQPVIRLKDEVYSSMSKGNFSKEDFEKLSAGSAEDYFKDMDKGITLPENQAELHRRAEIYFPGISQQEATERTVRGRNNWMVWTGGNDRFWDIFNKATFGGVDFLKTLSNHPQASTMRSSRWEKLGIVNEPCFIENASPRWDRYGLWFDKRDSSCVPDPFEDSVKYPGVKIGSRGKKLKLKINGKEQEILHEVGSSYGYASGIVGLRIFTNPDFTQQEANKWDPERYYKDPDYYNDPDLVKPYRVGMTCAFCHVGPSPINPPSNFNNPRWENLSSNVGAQYFWVDRLFFWNYKKDKNNLIHQLLHTSRPGTLDTSLISSDQINNPRTMNAVYGFPSRMDVVSRLHQSEYLKGAERKNMQFSDMSEKYMPLDSVLRDLDKKGEKNIIPGLFGGTFGGTTELYDVVISPRVLKDGSDSVGALGALNRVYVNIGLYSEEWLENFVPVLGTLGVPGFRITPFKIEYAKKFSGYWNANVKQTPDLALFFLVSATADKLIEVPSSKNHLLDYNIETVNLGKTVFADNCAACHSSKMPSRVSEFFSDKKCIGKNYLQCWNEYWNYTQTDLDYKNEMRQIVAQPDFLENNYLSTELRVPVDTVGTQVCSSIATNAIGGNIWDNFSSSSYKELPAVEEAHVHRPNANGEKYVEYVRQLPAGGRGFLRPPSLISIWSTAPFFNNNSLGPFKYQGTVESRISSFEESMNWLLNPDKRGISRAGDSGEKMVSYAVNGKWARGVVDVFQGKTYVNLPKAYVPPFIYALIPKKYKETYTKGAKYLKSTRGLAKYDTMDVETPEIKSPSMVASVFSKIGSWFSSAEEPQREIATEYSEESGDDAGYLNDPQQLGERTRIGPIPKGVPVNLISNIDLEASKLHLISAINHLITAIAESSKISDEKEAAKKFMEIAGPSLLRVSKCDDFVVNKGHYFGTKYMKNKKGLSSQEQKALIEFMKHM